MSDAGTAGFSDEEAVRLREYLLKGGFIWADDFWGDAALEHLTVEMAKILPPNEYPVRDIPLDAPDVSDDVPDLEAAADSVDPDLAAVSGDVGAWRRNRGRPLPRHLRQERAG